MSSTNAMNVVKKHDLLDDFLQAYCIDTTDDEQKDLIDAFLKHMVIQAAKNTDKNTHKKSSTSSSFSFDGLSNQKKLNAVHETMRNVVGSARDLIHEIETHDDRREKARAQLFLTITLSLCGARAMAKELSIPPSSPTKPPKNEDLLEVLIAQQAQMKRDSKKQAATSETKSYLHLEEVRLLLNRILKDSKTARFPPELKEFANIISTVTKNIIMEDESSRLYVNTNAQKDVLVALQQFFMAVRKHIPARRFVKIVAKYRKRIVDFFGLNRIEAAKYLPFLRTNAALDLLRSADELQLRRGIRHSDGNMVRIGTIIEVQDISYKWNYRKVVRIVRNPITKNITTIDSMPIIVEDEEQDDEADPPETVTFFTQTTAAGKLRSTRLANDHPTVGLPKGVRVRLVEKDHEHGVAASYRPLDIMRLRYKLGYWKKCANGKYIFIEIGDGAQAQRMKWSSSGFGNRTLLSHICVGDIHLVSSDEMQPTLKVVTASDNLELWKEHCIEYKLETAKDAIIFAKEIGVLPEEIELWQAGDLKYLVNCCGITKGSPKDPHRSFSPYHYGRLSLYRSWNENKMHRHVLHLRNRSKKRHNWIHDLQDDGAEVLRDLFGVKDKNHLSSGFEKLIHEFLHSLGRFGGVVIEQVGLITEALNVFDEWIEHTKCVGGSLYNRLATVTNFKGLLSKEARCRVGLMIKLCFNLNLLPHRCPKCNFNAKTKGTSDNHKKRKALVEMAHRLQLAYSYSRLPTQIHSFDVFEKYIKDVVFALNLVDSCIVIIRGTCLLHHTNDAFTTMVPELYELCREMEVAARIFFLDFIEKKHTKSGPAYKAEGNGSNGQHGDRIGGEQKGAAAICHDSTADWIEGAIHLDEHRLRNERLHNIRDVVINRSLQEHRRRIEHIAQGGYISAPDFDPSIVPIVPVVPVVAPTDNETKTETEEPLEEPDVDAAETAETAATMTLEEVLTDMGLGDNEFNEAPDAHGDGGAIDGDGDGDGMGLGDVLNELLIIDTEEDQEDDENDNGDYEQIDTDESKRIMGLAGQMVGGIRERKTTVKQIPIVSVLINSTEILGSLVALPLPIPAMFGPVLASDPLHMTLTRQDFRATGIQILLSSFKGTSIGIEVSPVSLYQFFIDEANCKVHLNLKLRPLLLGKSKKKISIDAYSGLLKSANEIILTFAAGAFVDVVRYFNLLTVAAPAYKPLVKTSETDYTSEKISTFVGKGTSKTATLNETETADENGFETRTCHEITGDRALLECAPSGRLTQVFSRFLRQSAGDEFFAALSGFTSAPGRPPPLIVAHADLTGGLYAFGKMNENGNIELDGEFTGCVNAVELPFRVGEEMPVSDAMTALFNKLHVPNDVRKLDTTLNGDGGEGGEGGEGNEGGIDSAEAVNVAVAVTRAVTRTATQNTPTAIAATAAATLLLQQKPPCKNVLQCESKKCLSSQGVLNCYCKTCQIEELRIFHFKIDTFLISNEDKKEFSTSWKRLIKCQLAAEKRLQEGTGVKPSDVRICYARYIDALRFVCWEIEIQRRKEEASAATKGGDE